jgi:predicted enzyme related to lactoylglutathione lyase
MRRDLKEFEMTFNAKGKFVWYELMTTDVKAAEAFYRQVVGWGGRDAGMGEPYTLLLVGEGEKASQVAGLMKLPAEAPSAGAPPHWVGYVGVDSADAYAKRFAESGGKIFVPPSDIPGIGRFAIVSDPQGAQIALFQPANDEPPPHAPAPGTPGTVGWHELYAMDGKSAFEFYAGVFGWTKGEAMDMGEAGVYQIFLVQGEQAGGIMTKMPEMPVPAWGYYINVEAIDAAAARVTKAGGQVIQGPMEVPGGQWIINGIDPQGAHFSLVAPKRA